MKIDEEGTKLSNIEELRNKFLSTYDENSDIFHSLDIQRVKEDNSYLYKFLKEHNEKKEKVDCALEMVKSVFKWRKDFGVHDINMETIPAHLFSDASLFPYNKDREDNAILIFRVKHHRKVAEETVELKRFLVYWVEKLEKETPSGRLTIIFDCDEARLGNLDMELIKFLISLFKEYYPSTLAYILVYEMPWLFNAAWKIIKSWLPEEAIETLKFVNRSTITNFVSLEQLPSYMGGVDSASQENGTNDLSQGDSLQSLKSANKKKVHFASPESSTCIKEINFVPLNPRRRLLHTNKMDSESLQDCPSIHDDFIILGSLIQISPAIEVEFPPVSGSEDSPSEINISLTNITEERIAFKVKTNNLDCYRVKPPTGIINALGKIVINVQLLPEGRMQPTDKFLIMATVVKEANLTITELGRKWRSLPRDEVFEHKIRCTITTVDSVIESEPTTPELKPAQEMLVSLEESVKSIHSKLEKVERTTFALNKQLNLVIYLLVFVALLSFIHLTTDRFSTSSNNTKSFFNSFCC